MSNYVSQLFSFSGGDTLQVPDAGGLQRLPDDRLLRCRAHRLSHGHCHRAQKYREPGLLLPILTKESGPRQGSLVNISMLKSKANILPCNVTINLLAIA